MKEIYDLLQYQEIEKLINYNLIITSFNLVIGVLLIVVFLCTVNKLAKKIIVFTFIINALMGFIFNYHITNKLDELNQVDYIKLVQSIKESEKFNSSKNKDLLTQCMINPQFRVNELSLEKVTEYSKKGIFQCFSQNLKEKRDQELQDIPN